ncbi:MAG: hypothetical protein WDM96_17615 [Lacunisphaera sp.]
MKTVSTFVLLAALVVGCAYVPASENKSKWFAILENGGPGKLTPVSQVAGTVYLEIAAKLWDPIIGPDGFGGPRTGYNYWTNLAGVGPVYRDPDLAENGRLEWSHHRGTIMIDKKNKKVIVDLQRIVSKPGEPEKLEPSPANGTYPIKRWIE